MFLLFHRFSFSFASCSTAQEELTKYLEQVQASQMTTAKMIAFAPGPNCNDSLRSKSKAAKFLRISETTGMCCL